MRIVLGGTPVQDEADLVVGLLGQYVIGLVEMRDTVFRERED